MAPIPIKIIQPTADWRHTFTLDPSTGEVIVDMALSATGDLALVTGIDRLVQMIIFWLLTPLGQLPWDPQYGNPYFAQLGRPITGDTEQLFSDMLDACEQAFLINQDQAAAAGTLTADEMVDHFADNQITVSQPGQIVVSFTVVARSGAVRDTTLPFAATLAAGQANPGSN